MARMRPHRLLLAPVTVLALAATVLASPAALADDGLGPLTSVDPSAPAGSVAGSAAALAKPALTRTEFAFRANGFGTSASGGMVPVGSDRTALSSIACTSDAGKAHRNFVEESEVPGVGTARGVSSRVNTFLVDGVATSAAVHKVAELVISESPLGTLTVDGIRSTTRAFNDGKFGAFAETTVAEITFTPPAGPPQSIPIPNVGQSVTIPGVATLRIGPTIEKTTVDDARAYAVGLAIKVIPTDTVVKIARSAAKIERGYKSGIFHGSGVPVKAKVLGELAEVGRVIAQVMPCTGTEGELDEADAADVNIGDQIKVFGASARQKGQQDALEASGTEGSSVAEIDLGGQLVIKGLRSQVEVSRTRTGKLTRSATASFGSITVGGEEQSLDQLGELEIPGVAKIQTGITKKIEGGISIVGVRVTLLDGTGAVLDFATSKLSISAS